MKKVTLTENNIDPYLKAFLISKGYLEEFLGNFNSDKFYGNARYPIGNQAINQAFLWDNTKEGFEVWADLSASFSKMASMVNAYPRVGIYGLRASERDECDYAIGCKHFTYQELQEAVEKLPFEDYYSCKSSEVVITVISRDIFPLCRKADRDAQISISGGHETSLGHLRYLLDYLTAIENRRNKSC